MNRRNFLKRLATAAAAFSILPAATTYTRPGWKKSFGSEIYVLNPEWKNAPYEWAFCSLDGQIVERIHESYLPARFRKLPMIEENLIHPYVKLQYRFKNGF